MEEASRVELRAAGGKIGWQGFFSNMHNHMQVKQEVDIGRGLNVSSRSKSEFPTPCTWLGQACCF